MQFSKKKNKVPYFTNLINFNTTVTIEQILDDTFTV